MKAAVDLAVAQFGRLDCVHANAGVLRNQKITDITLDDFHALINVNLLGPVLVAKHAIPVMERQGKGVICFTTSVAADIGFPGPRRLLRLEGGRGGADAQPDHRPQSRTACGLWRSARARSTRPCWPLPVPAGTRRKEVLYAQVAKKIPVQRMGQPIDVAHAVAFLLTDEAGFINGSVIHLEGGTLCLPPW